MERLDITPEKKGINPPEENFRGVGFMVGAARRIGEIDLRLGAAVINCIV
jgi:hypothetical protein